MQKKNRRLKEKKTNIKMGFKSAKQSHNNRLQVGGLILPSKEIYNAYKGCL